MTLKPEGKELVITRVLHAPRELVFQTWSEIEHLEQWWGPKGFELSHTRLDFRPGGFFHYKMQSADGSHMWGKFVYHEIEAPEKIVWVNSFSDEAGNIVRAPFSDLIPLEIQNTLTFSEENGVTNITLHSVPVHASDEETRFFEGMFDSMQDGFKGTFDQLEAYVGTLA
ncbi:SRPBCC domain-containing protein [Paenibacillus sp. 1P07SE]|uniref:SRPBCC domain-containing protein n=1 Tax=Paenibacillus sp. 1P07SE TaxID=3132209 RepID=UPI0039A4B021